MLKAPSLLEQQSSAKSALIPRHAWLWAAIHTQEEPRSRLAAFQGRYHVREAGPKAPILLLSINPQANVDDMARAPGGWAAARRVVLAQSGEWYTYAG